MSSRIMETLSEFAPRMEIYSIDEAFLDLHQLVVRICWSWDSASAERSAEKYRDTCFHWDGADENPGENGQPPCKKELSGRLRFLGGQPGLTAEMLSATPVGEIWGIGASMRCFYRGPVSKRRQIY